MGKTKSFVSEKLMGKGGTHAWYLGSIDPLKTITIIYETKEPEAKSDVKYYLFSSSISSLRQYSRISMERILLV